MVGSSASPSPQPFPPRRGGILDCESANPTRTDSPHPGTSFSLSSATLAHRMGEGLGVRAMGVERAGVRGNGATFVSMAEMFPGTVKLEASPGRAGGFPGRMSGLTSAATN